MSRVAESGAAAVAAPATEPIVNPVASVDMSGLGSRVAERVRELESRFEHIAATRMQGVPILHPGLRVQAVGFRPTDDGQAAVGVLVTPWFMNLVWLPLTEPASAAPSPRPPAEPATPVGVTRTRAVGCERFDFIGAHEPGFGAFEACSLFSPMADFADQEAAIATAEQVMIQLHAPTPPQPADAASDAARDPASETPLGPGSAPSRRALLFGRAAAAARESGR